MDFIIYVIIGLLFAFIAKSYVEDAHVKERDFKAKKMYLKAKLNNKLWHRYTFWSMATGFMYWIFSIYGWEKELLMYGLFGAGFSWLIVSPIHNWIFKKKFFHRGDSFLDKLGLIWEYLIIAVLLGSGLYLWLLPEEASGIWDNLNTWSGAIVFVLIIVTGYVVYRFRNKKTKKSKKEMLYEAD